MDCHLSWSSHSEAISVKIVCGVGILRHFKHFLPQKILLTLYYSLIYLYIAYGCFILSSNFFTNYKRVQVVQNKAIRIIGKYVKEAQETSACYKSLNMLYVGQIRDF